MRILLLDTETTGLPQDPNSRVTELAYMIYDTDFGVIRSKSVLINPLKPDEELTEEIISITGITTEMLRTFGYSPREVWVKFADKFQQVHAIMAAFAEFDRAMIEREFNLLGLETNPRVWLDFLELPFAPHVKGRSCSHIAADHGVLNYFAHRAFGDVATMAAVIEKMPKQNWDEMLQLASEPRVRLKAEVTFSNNSLAKAAGFKWETQLKIWYKTLPVSKVDAFVKTLTFKTSVVKT